MIKETDSNHNDIYLPQNATVLKSEQVTGKERFLELRLDSGEELGHMPGQFVEFSVPGIGEAPISISSSPTYKGSFQIVVRKVGNVTSAIHNLKSGDRVGIRGPFGTHFPVKNAMRKRHIVFVSGGLGLVPVRSAINYVIAYRDDYGDVTILYGAKNPEERLFIDEISRWKSEEKVTVRETVDRGNEQWTGNVGVITTLMTDMTIDSRSTVAIICGPPVMNKFAIQALYRTGMTAENIYLSMERHMKCGVGKCGHCQMNGLYVCQDGPVFRWVDIMNVEEAVG